MGIANGKRATSTLSVAPNMSHTPESTTSAARERVGTQLSPGDRQKLRDKIEHHIKNDYIAIRSARNAAKTVRGYDDLDDQQREQKQKEAALNAIQRRKDRNIHVSSFYTEFVDYVPPAAIGKTRVKDEEKDYFMYKQIHQLESPGYRVQRDEESDDEEPNPYLKKEESGETPAIENSALCDISREIRSAKRDTPAHQSPSATRRSARVPSAKSKQPIKRSATPRATSNADPEEDNDPYASDSEALTSLASDSEDNEASEEPTSSSPKSEEEEEESPSTPLVAVLRGQVLRPEDLIPYKPSKETLHLQRLAAIRRRQQRAAKNNNNNNNGVVAVLRGQIEKKPEDDEDVEWVWVFKKGMVPRKRVRETEGGEEKGQKNKKVKKAK